MHQLGLDKPPLDQSDSEISYNPVLSIYKLTNLDQPLQILFISQLVREGVQCLGQKAFEGQAFHVNQKVMALSTRFFGPKLYDLICQ